jgi:hypothetical protein
MRDFFTPHTPYAIYYSCIAGWCQGPGVPQLPSGGVHMLRVMPLDEPVTRQPVVPFSETTHSTPPFRNRSRPVRHHNSESSREGGALVG